MRLTILSAKLGDCYVELCSHYLIAPTHFPSFCTETPCPLLIKVPFPSLSFSELTTAVCSMGENHIPQVLLQPELSVV